MNARHAPAWFAAVWLVWLAGLGPLVNWMLPWAQTGSVAELVTAAAFLAYIAAPFLLIAYRE